MQKTQVKYLGREDPLEKKWQPSPVFLPGESHGQRSWAGYSPWGHKGSDMINWAWIYNHIKILKGFPCSSAGKESTCNAGDPRSVSGLERSVREVIGYPLQYSWASLIAQLVKNLPATRETWVWSLGWENPLEKGTATHSSILAWRIPWTEETGRLWSIGSQRVRNDWVTFTFSSFQFSHFDTKRYFLEWKRYERPLHWKL